MPGNDTCALLGDDFGVFVQVALAVLAFSSLFYKWSRERPRRAAKVWLFDISKQAFGAMLQHFYNILYSMLLSGDVIAGPGSECQWYFLNILVDTTVGVLLMYAILQVLKYWARRRGYITLMEFGDYGEAAVGGNVRILARWLQQLIIWLGIVIVTKIILSIVTLSTAGYLQRFTSLFFWPLYGFPKLELIIVMIIVPLLLNLLQFWVCDNFLKKKSVSRARGDYDNIMSRLDDDQKYGTEEKESSDEAGDEEGEGDDRLPLVQ